MELSSLLAKQFAEAVNPPQEQKEKKTKTYGTVVNGNAVILDGSTLSTPCNSTVSVNAQDRVLVEIEGHNAVIVGNLTSPALDETAVEVTVQNATEDLDERVDEAITSANGKNKVFHQGTAPLESAGLTVGDVWFDTANNYRINTWTGSVWSAFTLGSNAIADASITNAKIANATIQYGKIASLDMGAATTGKLAARYIDVDDLFAQNITVTNLFQVSNDYYSMTVDAMNNILTVLSGDEAVLNGHSY